MPRQKSSDDSVLNKSVNRSFGKHSDVAEHGTRDHPEKQRLLTPNLAVRKSIDSREHHYSCDDGKDPRH